MALTNIGLLNLCLRSRARPHLLQLGALTSVLASVLAGKIALADEHIYRRVLNPPGISGLEWIDDDAEPKAGALIVVGRYTKKNWILKAGRATFKPRPDGIFRVLLRTPKPVNSLKIEAFGPNHAHEAETLVIEVRTVPEPTFKSSSFSIDPSVGFTYIAYVQPGLPPISEYALTPKISAVWFISQELDIGLNAFANAATLGGKAPYPIQFLGANGRLGYSFQPGGGRWRLGLLAGAYFTTMLGNSPTYGFNNLLGPELFPSIRYSLSGGSALYLYGKYSPIADGFSLLGWGNRELALGFGWQKAFQNGNPLTVAFDFSNLSFSFDVTSINVSQGTISVGYGFR